MSCAPTPCPPGTIPTPTADPVWERPEDNSCLGGVFYNASQTYVDSCSASSPTAPISVTVPANTYTSAVSQEDVDDIAMLAATTDAVALRLLNPCQSAPTVGGFILTEDGDFLITEDDDPFIF